MKKSTLLTEKLPYFFFFTFALYWFIDHLLGMQNINYSAILLMTFMGFQFVKSKRILGFTTGIILAVLSVVFFLAVLSDFHLPIAPPQKFIIIGALVGLSCFAMALQMAIINYRKLYIK